MKINDLIRLSENLSKLIEFPKNRTVIGSGLD